MTGVVVTVEGLFNLTEIQPQSSESWNRWKSRWIVVCHGAPRIDAEILDRAPQLKFIGELEGDRFAARIDLEACWQRGIRTVDTTQGSSYPVAEWALALMLISLRNAGAMFRQIIAGNPPSGEEKRKQQGMLYGKRVGLIGCGHMGRRLIQLLQGFAVEIWVYDPYLPPEMAEAIGFIQTRLDNRSEEHTSELQSQ